MWLQSMEASESWVRRDFLGKKGAWEAKRREHPRASETQQKGQQHQMPGDTKGEPDLLSGAEQQESN